MKLFNKRSAIAMLLAAAMMSTTVAPVFAEGSRELNADPTGNGSTTPVESTAPMRSYLDWRDRDQFGMPSKNVVYVYAKEGETVFFGSDVTNASDKSIQAVVHKESMYLDGYNGGDIQAEISIKDALKGCSIAVTLPTEKNPNEAFDPEQKKEYYYGENLDAALDAARTEIQDYANGIFLSGDVLKTNSNPGRDKVYLFDVVEGGAGHIANPTMEKAGPNMDGSNTDGYEPLSFVAPYTGTYAFRFLSREYSTSDKMITPTMDPATLQCEVIDFDGLDEYAAKSYPIPQQYTATTQYYEDAYGDWIELQAGMDGVSRRYVTVKKDNTTIDIPATDYAEAVNKAVDNYVLLYNGTGGLGSINFTPKHDGAILELVLSTADVNHTEQRNIKIEQNGVTGTIPWTPTVTDSKPNANVITISSVNGSPIKAGENLKIYFSNNSNGGANVYEIRYYHHRADAGLDGSAVPTASPEPMQVLISFDSISQNTSRMAMKLEEANYYKIDIPVADKYNSDGTVIKANAYGYKYKAEESSAFDTSYSGYLACYGNNSINGGQINLTSYKDNAWFEFIVQNLGEGDADVNSNQLKIKDGNGNELWASSQSKEYGKFVTPKLNQNDTLTIYPTQHHLRIYAINYYYIPDESATVSEVAALSEESSTLVPISEDYTEWFDGYQTETTDTNGNTTYSFTTDTYFADNHFYTPTGNTYNSGKGSINDKLICLRIKNTQNILQFATAGAAEVTIYTESNSARGLIANRVEPTIKYPTYDAAVADTENVIAAQTVGTSEFTFTVDGATNIYLTSYDTEVEATGNGDGADFYIAGISVKMAPVPITLTPVSNRYTWDFYEIPDTPEHGPVYYETDTILGNGALVNGVDYDSSYPYDIMAHVTETEQIGVKSQLLYLYSGAKFDNETPVSGILELIPNWDGKISVSFECGGVEIYQPGKATQEKANNTSTGEGDYKSVSLEVEALKPVYIYQNGGSTYVKGITYIPEEPDRFNRKIDEKWATTGSEVAAWDITVAQGGGQTIQGDSYIWHPADFTIEEFGSVTTDDGLTVSIGGSHQPELMQSVSSSEYALKMNGYKLVNEVYSNYISYVPKRKGVITVKAASNSKEFGTKVVWIVQENNNIQGDADYNTLDTITMAVEAGEEVRIFPSETIQANTDDVSAHFYEITYEEDPYTPTDYTPVDGRVWTDVFFLNAGSYKASIYPKLNILTENGFLYDFWMNGTQPYSFVFYSNNRGFLLDRWGLYSYPENTKVDSTTDGLISLEHSFYSKGNSDVGPAPEKDENIENWDLVSPILGNYVPVDTAKDSTHMLFVNSPDQASFEAYTTSRGLRVITSNQNLYQTLLNNVTYEGIGNAASDNVGTLGIGGKFHVTITEEIAKQLDVLGSNQVGIVLDFSGYSLIDDENGVPVPELDSDNKWVKLSSKGETADEDEQNNIVTLSMVVDTTSNGYGLTYDLAWLGVDSYGNVVPVGTYEDIIASVVEMGTAHFPILDSEHNPNGFKVKMRNQGNPTPDYLYYNNEAVSPKKNQNDPSAWYFTGQSPNEYYPMVIGDGKNRTGGISTDAGNSETQGVMVYGEYDVGTEGDPTALETVYAGLGTKGQSGGDGGYGNYAAIDMWSRYKLETTSSIEIGVAKVDPLPPYVSFVAMNGETDLTEYPFKKSHVGFNGEVVAEYKNNAVVDIDGSTTYEYSTGQGKADIYGNTISTGFVTTVKSADNFTNDYVAWKITIPVSGTHSDGETEMPTYIKIPSSEAESFVTQEQLDEQEYLAYELYSSLFEDYAPSEEDNLLGDSYMPDWEAGASLDESTDVDIMDTETDLESAVDSLSQDSYIESIALLSDTEASGAYTNNENWNVTMNVDSDPVLEDVNSQVNRGNIYKITSFSGAENEDVKAVEINLQYKLPTITTGQGEIRIGLIIDNLYAPAASAIAISNASKFDKYHDITGLLTGTSNAVWATSYDEYHTNDNNEYWRGTHSENAELSVDYDLGFVSNNSTSVTTGGTEITGTQQDYSLCNNNVILHNFRYNNTHGVDAGSSIDVVVPGPVNIEIGTCAYDDVKIVVKDSIGNIVATVDDVIGNQQKMIDTVTSGSYGCGDKVTISYNGLPTTLTILFESSTNGEQATARFWLPYLRVTSK